MNDLNNLIEMRNKKKFIGMEQFNVEVIEQLNELGAFSINERNGKTYDNYKTILSLVTQENELTTPQKKLFTAIVMNDVFKYLDKCIKSGEIEKVETVKVEQPIKYDKPIDIPESEMPF